MSIVIVNDSADVLEFPEESESVTVRVHTPSDNEPKVQVLEDIVQVTFVAPALDAVTLAIPKKVPETFIFGVSSLVMLSVLDNPKSDVASRSGVAGAATVVLLITTLPSAVPASELTPPPD